MYALAEHNELLWHGMLKRTLGMWIGL